jgi:hypothetical protein
MKKAFCTLAVFFGVLYAVAVADENPADSQSVTYTVRDAYDATGNKYINYAGQRPSLMTFVNAGGSVTVCAADESAHDTYIYEYSKSPTLSYPAVFVNNLCINGSRIDGRNLLTIRKKIREES